jgi:hypothetical protein
MRPMPFAVAAVTVIVGFIGTGAAVAEKPSYGCAPGFNLGAYTFSDYLLLPRTEAAIDAGLVDEPTLLAFLAQLDRNGNEVVCVQESQGYDVSAKPFVQYKYNVVDDNASTR